MALHRGGVLALALGGRLFVELAGAKLGQEAGLFDGALEAAQRDLERLVFPDSDDGMRIRTLALNGRRRAAHYIGGVCASPGKPGTSLSL